MDEIIKDWEEKLKDFEADCALIDLEIQEVRKERERGKNRINDDELALKERRLRRFKEALLDLEWTITRLKMSYHPHN